MTPAQRPGPRAGTDDPPPRNGRVDGVDGLRSVAMTMVIAQHCGLLPFGWVGVWLFFVISGYVITRGFLAEEAPGRAAVPGRWRYGAFLRRRLVRIVPAYALYVGLCALLFAGPFGRADPADAIGLATFVYNWQMVFRPALAADWPAMDHLWTLSVEQQFYVFFPLLFLGLPDRLRWRVAGALVLLAPLTRWLWLGLASRALDASDDLRLAFSVYASTVCQLDAFLLGALVARFEPQLLARRGRAARWLGCAGAALVLYAVLYVALNQARGDQGRDLLRNIVSGILYGQGRELVVYSVVSALAAAVLLATLAGSKNTRWLSSPWLAGAGRISYGGYLFHALVLWGLSALWGEPIKQLPLAWRLPGFAAAVLLTVGLAWLSFTWLEQPVMRRCRRWAAGHTLFPLRRAGPT